MRKDNFSIRSIISASSGELRSDEIEICYIGFAELFRYEIINELQKLYKCTIIEAQQKLKHALSHYDPIMYKIMESLCEKEKDH